MTCKFIYSVFFLLFPLLEGCDVDVSKGEYSYKQRNEWPSLYPGCNGRHQSPIDINVLGAQLQWFPTSLNLADYRKPQRSAKIENEGHTVKVTVPGEVTVTGGVARDSVFKMESFHVHYGKNKKNGTEHRINGIAHAMEIHFVHVNTKYANKSEATKHSDGIMVLAVFVAVQQNPDFQGLKFVTDNLHQIANPNVRSDIEIPGPINLSQLLPGKGDHEGYFTYAGSLTTPQCQESVIWVVLPIPIQMSNNQFRNILELLDKCNQPMYDNIRPVQLLNDRTVGYVI